MIVLMTIILLLWSQTAYAADILTWDNNYSRDRSTTDTMFPYYSNPPIRFSLGDIAGTNLDSYSTPIVYRDTLYMFVWETNSWQGNTLTKGQLFAVDISKANPTSSSDFRVRWHLGISLASDGSEGSAYGVPGPSISPDGQYMSIAIGNYLYTWPMSENPPDGSGGSPLNTSSIPDLQYYSIVGNPGQTPSEIAMTPVVTTNSISWGSFNAPVTACGSWNGGFTAAPLYIPPGTDPMMVHYLKMNSLQLDAGSSGSAFTSSPIVNTNGDIIWGIDPNGGRATLQLYVLHPNLMQDVISGAQQMSYTFGNFIGKGHITNPLPSAPACDKGTGDIYIQDVYGYVYLFDKSGNYKNTCGGTANGGPIGSVNLAVDGSCVYAAEANGASIDALDKSSLQDWGSVLPGSTGYRNPSVNINSTTGLRTVIANDVSGNVYLNSVEGGNGSAAFVSDYNKLSGDPVGNDYSSVLADAGPNQELIAWTPSLPTGSSYSGELLIWPQSVPKLTAYVNPKANQPAATATVYAETTIPNTTSTLAAYLPNPDGTIQSTPTAMTFSGSNSGANGDTIYTWSLPFTVPNNDTGSTISAMIHVVLTYTDPPGGDPLSTNAGYYINPTPPTSTQVVPSGNQLNVSSYAYPINDKKTFQSWPTSQLSKAHPTGQTYMGDTILCNITSDVPPPPSGTTLDNAYITPGSASITHPKGYAPSDGQWQVQTVNDTMNVTGNLTATLQFEEDFDGWAPGRYTNTPDSGSQGSMELETPGNVYAISANWTIHENYHWTEIVCAGTVCVPVTHYGQIDYPMSDSKNVTVMGTDFVVMPIVAGNIYN